MKIGIVTQWYPPEPTSIPANLAEDLVERGHEVRVLTGFPNYPEGKIYPGYRQRWKDQTELNGVTVRRVPLYASHDARAAHRAANYLSFGVTSSLAALRFMAGVDVIYVYLTPATVFAAPALLRAVRRTPVVVHVQDLWPESVTASPMGPTGVAAQRAEAIMHSVLKRVYAASAGVIAIAPTMREMLIARGADRHRTKVIMNWADESQFRPIEPTLELRQKIGHRDRPTVMYAGTIGPFQNVELSVRAAASLCSENCLDLVVVGSGIEADAVRELARGLGVDNIRFLERQPRSAMAGLYAAADFQLVTLKNLRIFHGTIPSKLQAALACGSPVITSVPGDCASMVNDNGIGLAGPPDDHEALADCLRQASRLSADDRTLMSKRARQTYQSQMSRQAGVDQIESMLVAAQSRRRK